MFAEAASGREAGSWPADGTDIGDGAVLIEPTWPHSGPDGQLRADARDGIDERPEGRDTDIGSDLGAGRGADFEAGLVGRRRVRMAADAAAEHAELQAADAAERAAAAIAAAARAAAAAEAAAAAAEEAAALAAAAHAAETAYTERLPAVPRAVPAAAAERDTAPGSGSPDERGGPWTAPGDTAAGTFSGADTARTAGRLVAGQQLFGPPSEQDRDGAGGQDHGAGQPGGAPAEVPAPEWSVAAAPARHVRRQDPDPDATTVLRPAEAETERIPVTPQPGTAVAPDRGTQARDRIAAVALDAVRDPDTAVITHAGADVPSGTEGQPSGDVAGAEAATRAGRRSAGRRDRRGGGRDRATVVLTPGDPGRRGGSPSRRLPAVLGSRRGRIVAMAAVVALLVAATAVVATVTARGSATDPTPPVVTQSAPATSAPAPDEPQVDPTAPKAVAFLKALHRAGVPTSTSGRTETEAAAMICEQLAGGTDEKALVRALPAVLPTVSDTQAADVVTAAKKTYC